MIIFIIPLAITVFYFVADSMVTSYPSLDWFLPRTDPDLPWYAILLTGTSLVILECLIMLFSYWLHRKFPKEFSLSDEIRLNLIVGWSLSTGVQVLDAVVNNSQEDICVLNFIRVASLVDLIRCLAFITIYYWIAKKIAVNFPLPFTWVFQDFSKFIFVPECASVFFKYVRSQEPKESALLEKLMKLYVRSFEGGRDSNASSGGTRTRVVDMQSILPLNTPTIMASANKDIPDSQATARTEFLECLKQLEPCFERYKLTKSFKMLESRMKELERITEQGAQIWK